MKISLPLSWALILFSSTSLAANNLDVSKLAGMKARSIGPAGMSGRVTDIEVDPSDKNRIYVAAAAGGIWKSINGGITWQPIFDNQRVASVGAVAVDPTNSDVIWAGSGEGNHRNSVSVGNGIYKSVDGGVTWRHSGLEKTERIHRVLIHPRRPQTVYVAAVGQMWGENPQRGIFKTTDGGQTWKKVLYVNPRTGAADLVMDPHNPDKLIAAMWEHRRWPWAFQSGGPGSGIYLTFDGGETWSRRTGKAGLPAGELGRIGLAIADNRPNIVYALVEAEKSALLRSEDGGVNWSVVNDSPGINPRPFYYADIYVDPQNENRIYSLHSRLNRSEDGGKSFRSVVESSRIHGDKHALWIDPDDSAHLIDGSDGGVAISRDMGATWRFIENLPLAQFYHIAVDDLQPYNVYGGLQDNGSWRGPSRVLHNRGIFSWHWQRVGSGDGFDTIPDAAHPERFGYSMSQGGNLRRFDLLTGERRVVKPVHPDGKPLRFNWNAAIAQDPFDASAIYFGSQFLHRSRDNGQSWEILSPDLTTNDPEKQKQLDSGGLTYDVTGAENYTTIVTIAPSPVQQDVIWVGTDDGNVQLTRNGGKRWQNVVSSIEGAPDGGWVPHIEASPFEAGTAFVVFDNHRKNDWAPYLFRTTDFGRSWERLAETVDGYTLVVEQDPAEPRLLFLGTEFGLYFSIDAGAGWHAWRSGYPTTSTMDLAVHPREGDLVVGTHGRGVFILDDVRPLRELARQGWQILEQPLHLFDIPEATQYIRGESPGLRGPGDAVFQGENRPYGALITFLVNGPREGGEKEGEPLSDVKIEILTELGEVVRTLQEKPRPGVNRVAWRLDRKGVRLPGSRGSSSGEPGGFWVLPGDYVVRVTQDERSVTGSVRVAPDPRASSNRDQMLEKDRLLVEAYGLIESAGSTLARLEKARKTVAEVRARIGDLESGESAEIEEMSKNAGSVIDKLQEKFRGRRVQGIRNDPTLLGSRLRTALSSLGNTWAPPTPAQKLLVSQAKGALKSFQGEVDRFYSGQWADFRRAVKEAGLELF